MELLATVLGIAGAILIGSMSPGPSFVVVARRAIATTRADGIAAALGMGLGGAVFASAAVLGLHILLTAVPWLYVGLKVAGGLYLMYLALRLWTGAKAPLDVDTLSDRRSKGLGRSVALGLVTQISNPKTAVAYASIFSVLWPAEAPHWFAALVVPLVFVLETGWYTTVALVLSSQGPRRGYLKAKVWIDRLAGGVLGALDLKLVADAR